MREYFKQPKEVKKDKFRTFMKKNGADYIEDDEAIFKIPRIYGSLRIAIAIERDAEWSIGTINPECDNFENREKIDSCSPEEAMWLTKVLPLVEKWNKVRKGK